MHVDIKKNVGRLVVSTSRCCYENTGVVVGAECLMSQQALFNPLK